MRYGAVAPEGFLPVYSVDSEDEAHRLLVLTCSRDYGRGGSGEFIARELAREQTIENLEAFSLRLAKAHRFMLEGKKAKCQTQPKPTSLRAKASKR